MKYALSRISVSLLVLGVAAGCGGDEQEQRDTREARSATEELSSMARVEGRVAVASFPSAPTGVDAIDELGRKVNAPLAADGAFALALDDDHHYRLDLLTPAGVVPVAFARGDRLEKALRIDSDHQLVTLGAVRYHARRPDAGVVVRTGAPTDPPACVDGLVAAGTAACVEEAVLACQPGFRAGPDDSDDPIPSLAADVADPAQPFALPERNAPKDAIDCES